MDFRKPDGDGGHVNLGGCNGCIEGYGGGHIYLDSNGIRAIDTATWSNEVSGEVSEGRALRDRFLL